MKHQICIFAPVEEMVLGDISKKKILMGDFLAIESRNCNFYFIMAY